MTTHSPLIKLGGVSKVFHTDQLETHALSEIDMGIDSGEFVSIAGPSGCGKSTLLAIIGLLDTPTSGSYQLDTKGVDRLDARARARIRNRQIGFVFQAFNLIPDMTVHQNVELPLTYRDDMDSATRAQAVKQALHRVGIAHRKIASKRSRDLRRFDASLLDSGPDREAPEDGEAPHPSRLVAVAVGLKRREEIGHARHHGLRKRKVGGQYSDYAHRSPKAG